MGRLRALAARLARDPNPIWVREMRQSARLGRTPWVFLGLTLSLSLLVCSIGGISAASDMTPAAIGRTLFQVFFSLAYLVVVITGPAVAANAVASEREGKTWEAVLLTGLTPQSIARGKFMAACTSIALYIVVLAPVGALPFLFGGVTATEVVVAFAFLFLVSALAVAFGLAVSSLMSNLRGAIVLTLVLAVVIGPLLYLALGVGASIGVHKIWREVPEGYPIWLPLAYSRAAFGADYVLLLVALPLLFTGAPAWFLYEATVANLGSDGDDRSTGLKFWFAVCTPLLAFACAAPSAIAGSYDDRAALAVIGGSAVAIHLFFCAFLFVSEPPGPSRRLRVHWARSQAGFVRRFFGPGLPKTSLLVVALGLLALWGLALADVALMEAYGIGPDKRAHQEQVLFFALYASGFFLFVTGLAAWLRSRGQSPWIARLIAMAVVFLVSAGPWVVAAIGGVLSHESDDWLLIGAPSPFFAFYVVVRLGETYRTTSVASAVEVGTVAAIGWGFVGLVFLVAASSRSARAVRERDAAAATAEEALAAEERALATPPMPVVVAEAEPSPAIVPGAS